jgi:histidinol-phosphate/aromatic aminotransferase/cobyric acid decarboxylase-like protein/N-acyl-L-homoserine lactone synthetase
MPITTATKVSLSIASETDRDQIYKIRHRVYAEELQQHTTNSAGALSDELDLYNHYIVAKQEQQVVGFISITPPSAAKYSVDKYFSRSAIPYDFDDHLYEIRLLTIIEPRRNSSLALVLMFASFRWVASHGGKYIVSICRSDILEMYKKAGLTTLDKRATSGKVTYELCVAEVVTLSTQVQDDLSFYESCKTRIDWKLPFTFFAPSACYHAGAFFEAIGEDLQHLQRVKDVINADVLDAWFSPSPAAIKILEENLPWLLQTSPPTHAGGFIKVLSEVRGVNEHCILPGAGSSDLIFLALQTFLKRTSKVLIIDPCYGEYIHVLENIVKCDVSRFTLSRENLFEVNTLLLLTEIEKGYDMVILVNPNSPTGAYISKKEMEKMLLRIPSSTLVWIDETYIEYAGADESLEALASKTENTIICKSMSKVYALSGARAAYLCSSPHLIETLKALTPPWAISLPAQAAAIMALKDEPYYQQRYAETVILRRKLKQALLQLGIVEVIESVANFLLFYLPPEIEPRQFLQLCKEENLFLRDVSNMGNSLGKNAIRIAVKDEKTNTKMLEIMKGVMDKV